VSSAGDRTAEGSEVFGIKLQSPTGATVATPQGTMTILDDDVRLTAAVAGPGAGGALLTADAVQRLLPAAIAQWVALGGDAGTLSRVTITLAALGGLELGELRGTTIVLDTDAAGWGWSTGTDPVAGRIDLLSVLVHELGHVLGHGHDEHGAMSDTLAAGERLGLDELIRPTRANTIHARAGERIRAHRRARIRL
jgi:hypothetical protein